MLSSKLMENRIFKYFKEISDIPRGSGNEYEISEYLLNFAKKNNLFCVRDNANNVIIKKEGALGLESSPPVMLQGHMDMVCEKLDGLDHDFTKDPIGLKEVDGCITASGTTLGGDNGIAVAYCLALLESKDIPHPPLEVVITTDEERGMTGARELDTSCLSAKRLINLDSEEEGCLLVSCCGGRRVNLTIPISRKPYEESTNMLLTISGLKGGHSGADIHLQRANSNILIGRVLRELLNEFDIRLVSLSGGNVDNAITRDSRGVFSIKNDSITKATNTISVFEQILNDEYKGIEDKIEINLTHCDNCETPLSCDDTHKVIRALNLIPYGVFTMCANMEGLVETSSNPGVLRLEGDTLNISSSVRSSVKSRKELLSSKIEDIALMCGGFVEMRGDYPGWEFNPNSELLKIFKEAYIKRYNKEPKVLALHAGLECGLFAERLSGLDMISIGPDMWDVHTPQERLSIASVIETWEYLKDVLKNMK